MKHVGDKNDPLFGGDSNGPLKNPRLWRCGNKPGEREMPGLVWIPTFPGGGNH